MEIWTVMSWVPDWVAWGKSAPEMQLCLCVTMIRETDESKGREGTVLIESGDSIIASSGAVNSAEIYLYQCNV
jgi:hypothetical protein